MDTKIQIQTDINIAEKITGEQIAELRSYLRQSLSVFGWTLKRAVDPRAEYPYTRQYISRLEKNKDSITPEIQAAYWSIEQTRRQVPAGYGSAVDLHIIGQPGHGLEGAYLPRGAQTKLCKRPGCSIEFIKLHPSQEYHDVDCRKLAHKR